METLSSHWKKSVSFLAIALTATGGLSLPSLDAKRELPQVHYTGEAYRDPTVSPFQAAAKQQKTGTERLPQLKVQGLLWGGADPRAILNNQAVKKGDFVEGVEILDVSQNGVRIFWKGKSYFLKPGSKLEEKQ